MAREALAFAIDELSAVVGAAAAQRSLAVAHDELRALEARVRALAEAPGLDLRASAGEVAHG